MNSLLIIGNLTRDSELKYGRDGTAFARFSLAQNDRRKRGEAYEDYPMFFDVQIVGKRAESVNKFLVKGARVGVTGKIKQDRWEIDGKKKSKIYISCENIDLLSNKSSADNSGSSQSSYPQDDSSDFDDDIPF